MATLEIIKERAQEFADRRQILLNKVQMLQDEIEAVKRRYLPAIREAAETTAVAHEALYGEVKESPGLFEKPKTQILSGIRVGFKKEKGKIVIEDEERTLSLIRALLPSTEAELLIKTEEKVLKGGLDQLPASTLKKLGVTISSDTDAVFIKPIGDDIDKFVGALLEESEKILREVA
jgi:hypothetical protein